MLRIRLARLDLSVVDGDTGERSIYHPVGTGRLERHAAPLGTLHQVRAQGRGSSATILGGHAHRIRAQQLGRALLRLHLPATEIGTQFR
jgi:hypothetical protein